MNARYTHGDATFEKKLYCLAYNAWILLLLFWYNCPFLWNLMSFQYYIHACSSTFPCQIITHSFVPHIFIVHTTHLTSQSHDFISDLSNEFCVPFQLGHQECIVAVSVCNLVSPLIVYPNYGKQKTKKASYVCCQRGNGQIF